MPYDCSSGVVRASTFVLFGILFAGVGAPAQSDIGTLDHVRVLVRDVKAAQDVYRNRLGFKLAGIELQVFKGVDAVWILVKDLRDAASDAETLGFRRMRRLESKVLGGQGEEFETAREDHPSASEDKRRTSRSVRG